MESGQYEHTTEWKFKGRKVRTLNPLRNGWGEIPAGTIATITRKHGGFNLLTEPCPRCGLRASISKVPYTDVVLLPLGYEPLQIEPGAKGFCLVKVPVENILDIPDVKAIEAVVGMPCLIIASDIEVFIDNAALDELQALLKQIDAALKRVK